VGIEGVGKRTAAMRFAMACNCSYQQSAPEEQEREDYLHITDSCDCRSCRKIRSGNHPDIRQTEPSGAFIRIAQIRELCHTLGMKPYEARTRVVTIANAQTMNPEAGNALLKVLEEPPDRTVLILTTIQESDLLPTIVSRCPQIRFSPIPREDLETLLVEQEKVPQDDAAVIAALADGSYSKAFAMNRTRWIRRRNWVLRELESLMGRGKKDFPTAHVLAMAENLSKNKDILPDVLEVMKTWVRDLIICKYAPEKLINMDWADRIQEASHALTITALLSKVRAIQTAQKHLRSNANLKLTLEVLMMQLAK